MVYHDHHVIYVMGLYAVHDMVSLCKKPDLHNKQSCSVTLCICMQNHAFGSYNTLCGFSAHMRSCNRARD